MFGRAALKGNIMVNNVFGFLKMVSLAIALFIFGCTSNPATPVNNPPRIDTIIANPANPTTAQWTNLTCVAIDPDVDSLSYIWSSANGIFSSGMGVTVRWKTPDNPGIYSCTVIVNDGEDTVQDSIIFDIRFPNRSPLKPYNPNPTHGATNVSTTSTLTWECSDPDGDPITYDIYFGKSNYSQLVKINHTETSFTPGALEQGAYYSWAIVAKDDHGHVISSDGWWQFRVAE